MHSATIAARDIGGVQRVGLGRAGAHQCMILQDGAGVEIKFNTKNKQLLPCCTMPSYCFNNSAITASHGSANGCPIQSFCLLFVLAKKGGPVKSPLRFFWPVDKTIHCSFLASGAGNSLIGNSASGPAQLFFGQWTKTMPSQYFWPVDKKCPSWQFLWPVAHGVP